jgi:hypothetical protein
MAIGQPATWPRPEAFEPSDPGRKARRIERTNRPLQMGVPVRRLSRHRLVNPCQRDGHLCSCNDCPTPIEF